MSESNIANISLWARLGVSLSVTPQELEILRREDDVAKQLLVSLVRSDRCVLDGETYFPDPANEHFLPGDVDFIFSPTPIHNDKSRKPSLDAQIQSGEIRAAAAASRDTNKPITPEPER